MTDLVERITLAIFKQEGMEPSYPNPGNLRDCPWFQGSPARDTRPPDRRYPDGSKVEFKASGKGWMWVPASRQQGVTGALHVVALRIAMGQSLRQLISAWAPVEDGNKTERYVANVALWAAIPNVNTPLWQLF